MQYVNIHGQPISSLTKTTRPRSGGAKDIRHMGWRAVGFSPQQLEQAEIEHEKASQRAAAAGARGLFPFNRDQYMRSGKPAAIRSKPYDLREAADIACRLAEREGWVGCRVEEIVRR